MNKTYILYDDGTIDFPAKKRRISAIKEIDEEQIKEAILTLANDNPKTRERQITDLSISIEERLIKAKVKYMKQQYVVIYDLVEVLRFINKIPGMYFGRILISKEE